MSDPPGLNTFFHRLTGCGLFDNAQLDQFENSGHPTAEDLASYLEDQGLLTTWQKERLWSEPTSFVRHGFIYEKKLGEGTYGICYLVRDQRTTKPYALKELRPNLQRNTTVLNRFQTEMKALRSITNPNIIKLYRFELRAEPWFSMEYHEAGKSLKEWAGRTSMSIPLACEICLQVARGLDAALRQEIIHRDIAPSNILIVPMPDQSLIAKVLDFGVAKFLREVSILTNHPLGHPEYMSIRAIEKYKEADTRDDLFALGCVFYQLLTGKLPYAAGGDVFERLRILKTVPCVPIREIRPDIPEDVADVVHQLLNLPIQSFWRRLTGLIGNLFGNQEETGFQNPEEVVRALTAIRANQPRVRYQAPPPRQQRPHLPSTEIFQPDS